MADTQDAGFTFSGVESKAADATTQANNTSGTQGTKGETVSTQNAGEAGSDSLENIMTDGGESKQPEAEPDKGTKPEGSEDKEAVKPAWTAQLPAELQGDETFNSFAKIADLAKAYKDLSAKSKDGIAIPGNDSSAEEKESFYQKLGKPKTKDGYDIEGSDPEALREIAFKSNLTKEQAKVVFSSLGQIGQKALTERKAQLQKMAVDTESQLKSEYGSGYSQKMQLLKKGMDTYGGKNIRQKLSAAGLSFDPDIVHMFITLGELSSEATSTVKGSSSGSYKSKAEGGQFTFKGL